VLEHTELAALGVAALISKIVKYKKRDKIKEIKYTVAELASEHKLTEWHRTLTKGLWAAA
jgi:hypothetical protein